MAMYEVNPLITTTPKNVFKSLWYTYIREMKKPKPISIADQIREDLNKMNWGRWEGWISSGWKGYYLKYPESMEDYVLEELNELNDKDYERRGIIMPYTPSEKYEWEAQKIYTISEWIDGVTDFVSANEELLIPVGMKRLPFRNSMITKKVIGFLKGAILIISSIILEKCNKDRNKLINIIDKLPTKEEVSRGIKHTYLKPAANLAFAVAEPISTLRTSLENPDSDVGILVANCINDILDEIGDHYVDSFANSVVALKAELNRRRQNKKNGIDDKSANAIFAILGNEFGKILENAKENAKNQDEVIIPEEVVSNTETSIPMVRPHIVSEQTVADTEHPVVDPFPNPTIPQQKVQTEPNPMNMHIPRVDDPSDNPVFYKPKPMIIRTKPEFIVQGANEQKSIPLDSAPEVFKSSLKNIDPKFREYFEKNLWALKITDIANSKGLKTLVSPSCDSAGNLKFMSFKTTMTQNTNGVEREVILDDKSFIIDVGQVINRDYNIWPCFQNGREAPIELCDVAYKLFKRAKNKKDISGVNYDFISKVFEVGFSNLNKSDIDGVVAFKPELLERNRHIVLITLPMDNLVNSWREISEKLYIYIMEFQKKNYNDPKWGRVDLRDYRFALKAYNPNDLTMLFSSKGISKYFMYSDTPRAIDYDITVYPVFDRIDDNGIPHLERDENGLPNLIADLSVSK